VNKYMCCYIQNTRMYEIIYILVMVMVMVMLEISVQYRTFVMKLKYILKYSIF
jgi:hypothetical protein